MQMESKFTPVNIRQIATLLDRGKTNEEIAEIIGVTPGTLKVTCSRLGISLRRRSNVSPPGELKNGHSEPHRFELQQAPSIVVTAPPAAPVLPTPQIDLPPLKDAGSSGAAFTLRYRGERRIDIPLDRNLLGHLALEADFRSVRMGALIADLLRSIAENDMFAMVLKNS